MFWVFVQSPEDGVEYVIRLTQRDGLECKVYHAWWPVGNMLCVFWSKFLSVHWEKTVIKSKTIFYRRLVYCMHVICTGWTSTIKSVLQIFGISSCAQNCMKVFVVYFYMYFVLYLYYRRLILGCRAEFGTGERCGIGKLGHNFDIRAGVKHL